MRGELNTRGTGRNFLSRDFQPSFRQLRSFSLFALWTKLSFGFEYRTGLCEKQSSLVTEKLVGSVRWRGI